MMKTKNPTFICIGPEKTGTTLLYSVLKNHPSVSLPPIKELRYWDEGTNIPKHSLGRLLFSKHWHYVNLRKPIRSCIKYEVSRLFFGKKRNRPDMQLRCKYLFGKRSHEWYQSLFDNSCKVTGDISPLYYHLPKDVIKSISNYNPSTKIIVFIREPIDRTWSKAKMNLLKHRQKNVSDLSFDDFRKFCERQHEIWVPYEETIQNWKEHFENVHISIYDDLKNDPTKWYREICDFLQIEPMKTDLLQRNVNKGIQYDIPSEYLSLLFEQYGAELKQLAQSYSRSTWLGQYQELTRRFGSNRV